jgi:hypothetical protein
MNARIGTHTGVTAPPAHLPGSVSEYITAGSLPDWEQVPPDCLQELVQTLACLLVGLPEVQQLAEAPDERQP